MPALSSGPIFSVKKLHVQLGDGSADPDGVTPADRRGSGTKSNAKPTAGIKMWGGTSRNSSQGWPDGTLKILGWHTKTKSHHLRISLQCCSKLAGRKWSEKHEGSWCEKIGSDGGVGNWCHYYLYWPVVAPLGAFTVVRTGCHLSSLVSC